MREQHYFSVRSSVRASVLLIYWAEFDQTCYFTSAYSKAVREQRYFFRASVLPCIRRPSICTSRYLLLNHWAEFNQTCYITSPRSKGVRKQHYFFVRPSFRASVVRPSVLYSISFKTTVRNLPKLGTLPPLIVRVCGSKPVYPQSVFPSVSHATCISIISNERWDFRWRAVDCAF